VPNIRVAGFQTPGFLIDTAEYASVPEAFNEVKNARFNSVGAVSIGGSKMVLAPASITPLWLKLFPPISNPIWTYGNLDKMYAFQAAHADITRISGDYNGIAQERWHGEMFNGVGIFNNTQDIPQAWLDFSTSTPLIDLPHWPVNLRAKFVRTFKQFLFAGNLNDNGIEQPFRLRWSHPADPGTVPASWALNDPTKDSGQFDIAETDDSLVDALGLGEYFIVYKQKSAYVVQYIGGTDVFGYRQLHATRGILCRDCVQPIPQGHFVAGIDDIYAHSGQRGTDVSLVDSQLRKWIFNQIGSENFFNCYTVKYVKENEIWFCFPEAGETYPTLAAIWNTVTKGWGVRDIPGSPFIYPGPAPVIEADQIWGDDPEEEAIPEFCFVSATLSGYVGYSLGVGGTISSNTTSYTITQVKTNLGYGDLTVVSADLYAAVLANPSSFSFRFAGPGVDQTFSGSAANTSTPDQLTWLSVGAMSPDENYCLYVTET
jgi:hypothetical protein